MNVTKLLTLGACAALVFSINARHVAAHEGEDHHSHAVTVPETPDAIVAEIHKHHTKISEVVKAKNLAAVHDHSDAIVTLAKALPEKVAPDKKDVVQSPVNQITKAAGMLHEATDANNQADAETRLKNLESSIAQLERKLK